MNKEFNLSEKVYFYRDMFKEHLSVEDVKEFIRLLKIDLEKQSIENEGVITFNFDKVINELAGEKFI